MRCLKMRCLGALLLTLMIASPATANAQETARERTLESPAGPVEYEIQLPRDYDPSQTYPVAFGGGYYWRGLDDTAGWILVTTALGLSGDWRGRLRALIDGLGTEHRIESGRLHMVCYSACGGPAFTVAAAFPEKFQSVTALTGSPRSPAILDDVKHMKIRLIVGENDGGWRRGAEAAYRDFRAAGANVELEIVPGAGHVIDEIVGAPFLERMDALRD